MSLIWIGGYILADEVALHISVVCQSLMGKSLTHSFNNMSHDWFHIISACSYENICVGGTTHIIYIIFDNSDEKVQEVNEIPNSSKSS